MDSPEIFISYKWETTSKMIAEKIYQLLKQRGFNVIKDDKDMEYKANIYEFEERLGRGGYIITIISDAFLKSEHCMYEMVNLHFAGNEYKRLFPIILEDVKIHNARSRLNYIKYWKNEIESFKKDLNQEHVTGIDAASVNDLKMLEIIGNGIGDFDHLLSNMNTLSFPEHEKNNYSLIIEAIENQFKADGYNVPECKSADNDVSQSQTKTKEHTEKTAEINPLINDPGIIGQPDLQFSTGPAFSNSIHETEKPLEIIHKKDNSQMMLISGGVFIYGGNAKEEPIFNIDLPSFYMDKYPVTNNQFSLFLNTTNPDKTDLSRLIGIDGKSEKERSRITKVGNRYAAQVGFEEHPVIFVSWYGANAYADWAGKRLPAEQEWEKSARGIDGRIYPWGNEWNKRFCNSAESGIGGTTPVNKFEAGKSIFGCFDLVGNVLEWTSSLYNERKILYVIRGGSWYSTISFCRCAFRGWDSPYNKYLYLGFRCAKNS